MQMVQRGGVLTFSQSPSITSTSDNVLDAVSTIGSDGIPTRVNRIADILNRTGITSEGTTFTTIIIFILF